MHAVLKIAAPLAALTFAAVTLTACVVAPAPYYDGGGYYAAPAQGYYYGPSYYYGSGYYYGPRWRGGGGHGGHGGGWHGGGHHWH